MAGPRSSRLFVALWPDAAVRTRLAAWQRGWTLPAPARPTRQENLHLTLHFLGQVDDARVSSLRALLASIPWPELPMGSWHGAVWARQRLAVALPQAPSPPLEELHARHAQLGAGLRDLGFASETRRFQPHLTLAREAAAAQPPAEPWPSGWIATAPVLVRSDDAGYELLAQDPFGLARFVTAQDEVWPAVGAELRAACKRNHWMWFVFPQLRGLGHSPTAQRFGITGAAEATAYLAHPLLAARLRECCGWLLQSPRERDARTILGTPDDFKLRSSMTLFAAVAPDEPLFDRVLARFWGGDRDGATLALLAGDA